MNLECTSKAQIGLIGTVFLAGWGAFSIFLPRLSDILGRRVVIIGASFAHVALLVGLILSKSLTLNYVLMFFCGGATMAKIILPMLYAIELSPKK